MIKRNIHHQTKQQVCRWDKEECLLTECSVRTLTLLGGGSAAGSPRHAGLHVPQDRVLGAQRALCKLARFLGQAVVAVLGRFLLTLLSCDLPTKEMELGSPLSQKNHRYWDLTIECVFTDAQMLLAIVVISKTIYVSENCKI
jgi:hypothetical protein